ncbi:aminoglycoside 6-adenylyltransferase [Paenibacillus harenae]|uniref:Aminoglycoside 6-adenylyltransferase n=1 Tax=Paenibacillus harenae TaxID=306543 RepID=A0ABT9U4K0_PAEHA|nr:aminoglycoside 6-adenylyltransferase [Paenibacillus harenae]MDQ0062514.1 aminoglycoside 6-adenylyltransferase [Paenibacillus harenae]MDQ0114571.1 aminoglycoside 6-adenylyltransferase [Paenibacillus harenae]
MTIISYEMLEERIYDWGNLNSEIMTIYVMGSRARINKPFDEFSDLDVVIFASNPDYYFRTDEWLLDIGEVWTNFVFRTAGGDPEKLVLFDQALQVDFLFRHVSELESLIENDRIPQGFQRGARILLDKTGRGQRLLPKNTAEFEVQPITEAAFLQVVNIFGFGCIYVAKQILRGEMWIAYQRDEDCKQMLLQMIEWHAKSIHGSQYDTWHAGKFVDQWAEQGVIADLKQSFGGYDQNKSWEALIVTFELFNRLSSEVANTYGFTYPEQLVVNIRSWLKERRLGA